MYLDRSAVKLGVEFVLLNLLYLLSLLSFTLSLLSFTLSLVNHSLPLSLSLVIHTFSLVIHTLSKIAAQWLLPSTSTLAMDHNVHSISPHPIDVVPSPATVSPTVRLRSTTSRADRGIAKAYPHALPTPPPTASAVFAYPSSRATPNSMRVNAHPPSSVVPAGHFIGRGVFQAVPPKKLRPYQAEAVAQFWRDYAEGLTRLGFYLPLEDEKSVIYCTIVAEVLAATRKPNRLYSKALILVETEDLVTSCMAKFVKMSGLSVGPESGGIRAHRSCRV